MANGLELLATRRINGLMNELRDIRELPQDLRFLNRTPVRNATDGELMGRFRGEVLVADIIFEGGRATTHNTDKFSVETQKIPKLKHGVLIDEEMINLLQRLQAGGGIPNDQGILKNYTTRQVDKLLLGIRQRLNALIVAMQIDAFSYNRGGIVIDNASWGMPANQKVDLTGTRLWSAPTTATPITDISTQAQFDSEYYGEVRNRITMSSTAFRAMIATAEFTAKAQLYSGINFPAGSFPLLAQLGPLKNLMQTILEMEIELEDSRYWMMANDGSLSSAPYLPPDTVILGNSSDDNNESAMYVGNAIVPETVVSSLANVGSVIGQFSGPEYGPVAWSEAVSLNPPDLVMWACMKCWPKKERLSATSRLKVL